MNKIAITSLITLSWLLAWSLPAEAGLVNLRKIKKWPAEDQAWARSFDSWMSEEEIKLLVKMKTTEERQKFLTDLGYWKMWEDIEDEIKPHIIEGKVIEGMNQDEVYMCWDKPKKIRKDFRKSAYVNVLNYEFEIDRKGREFLLRPDSQTAYKNEVVTKFVYMYNERVFAIVYEGQEESAMEALPGEDAPDDEAETEATPVEAAEGTAEEGGAKDAAAGETPAPSEDAKKD